MERPWELLCWDRLWGRVPSWVAGGPMSAVAEGASSFQHLPLWSISTSLLLSHQDANVPEDSRHHLPFFFFLFKVIFESPSHSYLPMENFIHFPSNGNFFFLQSVASQVVMSTALWIQKYGGKKTQPNLFSSLFIQNRGEFWGKHFKVPVSPHRSDQHRRSVTVYVSQVAMPSAGTRFGVHLSPLSASLVASQGDGGFVLSPTVGNLLANKVSFQT